MPVLYYAETLNPHKVCAVANYLKTPLNYERIDLRKGQHKSLEHIERHPLGKVPVLVHEGGALWESGAIMAWLSNAASSDLWPASDPVRQVEVLRWLLWDAFHFLPLAGTFYFERHIKPLLGIGEPDANAIAAKAPQFHQSAKVLDAQLATRRFVTGDRLSIADFALGAVLPYAAAIDLPLEPYANIRRWQAQVLDLPGFANPWPR